MPTNIIKTYIYTRCISISIKLDSCNYSVYDVVDNILKSFVPHVSINYCVYFSAGCKIIFVLKGDSSAYAYSKKFTLLQGSLGTRMKLTLRYR